MIGETMVRPDGSAERDALLAMLLYARDDAMRLNLELAAHFLEMACLDLALEGAASFAVTAVDAEAAGIEMPRRRRTTLRSG